MLDNNGEQFVLNFTNDPAFHRFQYYDYNPLSGNRKTRVLYAPNSAMAAFQKALINRLSLMDIDMPHATAFKRGMSPVQNLKIHRMNRYFYLTDIKDAYPSVNIKKLAEIIAQASEGKLDTLQVFAILKKNCMALEGGLPIGANASPMLFNIYANEVLDKPLGQLCKKWHVKYTRYCDDLTFSSFSQPFGKKKRRQILNVIRNAGFDVSYHKTQVRDLRQGAITICGFRMDINGRIFLPKSYRSKIAGRLYMSVVRGQRVCHNTLNGYHGMFRMGCVNSGLTKEEKRIQNFFESYYFRARQERRSNRRKQKFHWKGRRRR